MINLKNANFKDYMVHNVALFFFTCTSKYTTAKKQTYNIYHINIVSFWVFVFVYIILLK